MTGIRSWIWQIGAIVHNTAVINPGFAVARWKIRRKPRYLLIRQPIEFAHYQSSYGA